MQLINSVVPISDVWKNFVNGILAGSLRKAISNAALALHDATIEVHDWQIGGHVSGKAGETKTIEITPQSWFLGEKLMLTESVEGNNVEDEHITTIVVGVFVGQKNQMPVGAGSGGGLHGNFFSSRALGNAIKWTPARPSMTISIQLRFTRDCTAYTGIFGKAVLV